jgi:hypothetical protein
MTNARSASTPPAEAPTTITPAALRAGAAKRSPLDIISDRRWSRLASSDPAIAFPLLGDHGQVVATNSMALCRLGHQPQPGTVSGRPPAVVAVTDSPTSRPVERRTSP